MRNLSIADRLARLLLCTVPILATLLLTAAARPLNLDLNASIMPVAAESPGPHWVPDNLPRYTGAEAQAPYGSLRSPNAAWQVQLASALDEPQLLYQTGRYLWGAEWSPNGQELVVSYETQGMPDPSINLRAVSPEQFLLDNFFLHGIVSLDLSVSSPPGYEELLLNGSAGIGISPDFTHILVTREESSGGHTVYAVDRRGHAQRLDGVGIIPLAYGWLPDSSGVMVVVASSSGESSTLYLIPLDGSAVTEVAVAQRLGSDLSLAWSPDGNRLAYGVGADLYVLNRTSGATQLLSSNAMWRGTQPSWTRDGETLIIGGTLLNAATGEIEVTLGAPYPAAGVALSPDGRFFAVAEDTSYMGVAGPRPCPSRTNATNAGFDLNPDNRVYVYDRQNATTALVQDCGAGLTAKLQWLADDEHLVLWQQPDQVPVQNARGYAIALLDTATGQSTALTSGREIHAGVAISPDRERLLVIGTRLRMYIANGSLLREVIPAAGFDVPFAAWSPDGTRFTYILGPAGFFPEYP